jgi:hypothetical protein
LNPQPLVLETSALPIELHPWVKHRSILRGDKWPRHLEKVLQAICDALVLSPSIFGQRMLRSVKWPESS